MADSEKVSQLVELGLTQEQSVTALIKTGNNLEQAIALIFEEPTSIKAADSGTILLSDYRSRYARGYIKES